jgi:Zn-dependent protease with chaperone function
MDFFDAQESARRRSKLLVALFLAAVLSMIAVVYAVVAVGLGFTPMAGGGRGGWIAHPDILLWVSLAMGLLIGGGAAFRTAQLSKGGGAVATLLGGRPVDPATSDPRERVYLNVVEEMSIASGVPVPAIFILDRESGINAFAAGHLPTDAAVAVTRGALDSLTRDELQGVVAHEFSHILNGDMRLNIRIMGLLFGIFLLTEVGRGLLRVTARGGGRSRGGKNSGAGQIALIGVLLLILGYLGTLFGRIIQAAVSRQREFLADSAAVEFTRNPGGLAGALIRIGGEGSRIQDHHAQEAGHLFFAGGLGRSFLGLFATHPPLDERIRRIDPRWDGSFGVGPGAGSGSGSRERPARVEEVAGLAGTASAAAGGAGVGAPPPLAAALMASVGTPEPRHVAHARELLAGLPSELREAVRTPEGAVAIVLALSASAGEVPPFAGLGASHLEEGIEARVRTLHPAVRALDTAQRLPLLELAAPTLRTLTPEGARGLLAAVRGVIQQSGVAGPFEFALFHIVRRVSDGAGGRGRTGGGSAPLTRLRSEAELVLSAVAHASSVGEEGVQHAFHMGAAILAQEAGGAWQLRPRGAVTLDQVDAALVRFEGASPAARKALLSASATTVQGDGRVESGEGEILRAIAEALDVPLPPLVPR